MPSEFEWDQWNGRKSYLKHGITNLEAETIFDDPNKNIFVDDKHSEEEDRYICIGKSALGRILFCVYTYRNEKIRIISTGWLIQKTAKNMKAKKKEIFFVRETPDSYEIDYSKAKRISNREHERLLKDSKKPKGKKAA